MFFATALNFACIVSELEKHIKEKYEMYRKQRFLGVHLKDWLSLLYLAVFTVALVVATLKSNLERNPT